MEVGESNQGFLRVLHKYLWKSQLQAEFAFGMYFHFITSSYISMQVTLTFTSNYSFLQASFNFKQGVTYHYKEILVYDCCYMLLQVIARYFLLPPVFSCERNPRHVWTSIE